MWDWSLLLAPWKDSNGGFCPKKKKREPNASRLWTRRGGDKRSPVTLYIILCLCCSRALAPGNTIRHKDGLRRGGKLLQSPFPGELKARRDQRLSFPTAPGLYFPL